MGYIHYGSHTVYDIQYHIVWTTEYRYKILRRKIAKRLRELIRLYAKQETLKMFAEAMEKNMCICLFHVHPAPSKLLLYKGSGDNEKN